MIFCCCFARNFLRLGDLKVANVQFSDVAMYISFFPVRTAFVSPSFENVDPDDDELVDELNEGLNLSFG